MSGGVGIVRTGAAARSGVGVLTVPAPAGIPLARRPRRRTSVAVAAAKAHRIVLDESLSSVMRSIGLHVTGGQRGHIGRLAGSDGAPVLCTVVCRFDPPAEGRAAAGRFDVADSYAPSWWAPGRTRGRARYSARGPAAGPAAGQDPAGAAETRASGARTPRSRQAEPRPGRVITALIPKCDVFSADMPGIGITLTRWGVP